MKIRWILSGIAGGAVLWSVGASACPGCRDPAARPGVSDRTPPPAAASREPAAGTRAARRPQTRCPVMNAPIDRNLYVDHEGKRVYVCCRGCLAAVRARAAEIIRRLEAEGIEVAKVPAIPAASR